MANDRKRSALPDDGQDAPDIDIAEEATPPPRPNPVASAPPPARPQAPLPPRQPRFEQQSPSLSVERPTSFPQPPTRKRKDALVEQEIQSQAALRAAISRSASTPPALYLMLLALIGGTGYMGYKFYFSGRKLARTSTPAAAAPSRSASSQGTPSQAPEVIQKASVVVETDMIGFEVFANDEPVQLFNNRFELPAGEVVLLFKRAGFDDFTVQTRLQPGETRFLQPVFVQEQRQGFLTYETVPSAKLTLFQGEKAVFEMTTPFEGQSVPIGKYRAVLVNDLIGFRSEEEIQVEEWKTTSVRRQLQSR